MRAVRRFPLIFAMLGHGCAKHADPCTDIDPLRSGPPGAHRRLVPEATELAGSARVPGAPGTCVAKFFVRGTRESCPAHPGPSAGNVTGVATSTVPAAGTTCWLSCDRDEESATWALSVPIPTFRGEVTCTVEGGGKMQFEVVDPAAGFSASSGAAWLTQIGGDGYAIDYCTGKSYVIEMACPLGQPTRGTGP